MRISNNQCFARYAVSDVGEAVLLEEIRSVGLLDSPGAGHASGRVLPVRGQLSLGHLGSGMAGSFITPLSAARLASALAEGELVQPYWIRRVVDAGDNPLALPRRREPQTGWSPRVAAELRNLLVNVTEHGTARSAFHDRSGRPRLGPIRVAGKTGTVTGRHPVGRYQWFIGVAPAEAPRIAIATVVADDSGRGNGAARVAVAALAEAFCEEGRTCEPARADQLRARAAKRNAEVGREIAAWKSNRQREIEERERRIAFDRARRTAAAHTVVDLDRPPIPIGVSGFDFPRRLRRSPVDGQIVLLLEISEKGEVLDVQVASSDLPDFSDFVSREVRGWSLPLRPHRQVALSGPRHGFRFRSTSTRGRLPAPPHEDTVPRSSDRLRDLGLCGPGCAHGAPQLSRAAGAEFAHSTRSHRVFGHLRRLHSRGPGGIRQCRYGATARGDRSVDLPTRISLARCCWVGTLAPGETRTLEADFAPVKPGRVEGAVDLTTDEVSNPRYPVAHTAMGIEPPSRPLDLVFVLDVSTSMDEIAILRDAMGVVFDAIEAASLDVQVGLTTFENDVIVHGRGSFLDRVAFFRELDSQLVEGSWIPDGNQPRQLLNFELEENLLDALHRSATEFDFRTEARRYLFLMTDDTYLEPPAVFSDGSRVIHSYLEVVSVLTARDISVFSAHRSAKGRGLSSDYDGGPSLVERTGGEWLELGNVQAASLARMLGGLLTRPDCR